MHKQFMIEVCLTIEHEHEATGVLVSHVTAGSKGFLVAIAYVRQHQ